MSITDDSGRWGSERKVAVDTIPQTHFELNCSAQTFAPEATA